jgi:hypothetical protein
MTALRSVSVRPLSHNGGHCHGFEKDDAGPSKHCERKKDVAPGGRTGAYFFIFFKPLTRASFSLKFISGSFIGASSQETVLVALSHLKTCSGENNATVICY